MKRVEPKVFCVAATQLDHDGLSEYLEHVGAPDWETDAGSGMEALPEVMGRLCYRSWKPGMNANVTRVREGNDAYLENIARVRHGSVVEHASASFIFADVSRVFTHELVRHRVGTAMSQESLRFVRLTDLKGWMPSCFTANDDAAALFEQIFESLEEIQRQLAEIFELGSAEMDFAMKKVITSAMRRLAPIGLATTIGWTANVRTLRHVIEMRTSRHAEEEIRLVFSRVAEICRERWPNLFADYEVEEVDGYGEWTTPNSKI